MDRKNWAEANMYCQQVWSGSTLAIIPNINSEYFIASLVRNIGISAWIGGLSTINDNTFHWLDGSRMIFSYWQPGEPNNWDGDEDKIEVKWYSDNQFNSEQPGQWNDQTETEKRAFICSHNLDSTQTEQTPQHCPQGWLAAPQIGSFCYKLIMDRNSGYKGAQDYCQSLESETNAPTNLVSVEDTYEVGIC